MSPIFTPQPRLVSLGFMMVNKSFLGRAEICSVIGTSFDSDAPPGT